MKGLIGVLGGMGPAATVDYLINLSPLQQHNEIKNIYL